MTATEAPPDPRLVLTLPGVWLQIDPSDPQLSHRRIGDFVKRAMGRADELATVRAALREALGTLMERSATGGAAGTAESVFVCDEVSRGTKLPLCVSIFTPERMRISPTVGTAPDAVIGAFHEALVAIGDGDGWERVSCRDGEALRRVRVVDEPLTADVPDATARIWGVDYWRTVPESKRLVLVTATSPLADIPETLVRLTDAIVVTSRFVVGRRPSLSHTDTDDPGTP